MDSSKNAVKCPHQIAVCELIVPALCSACSLQMYQFPVGNGWKKRTYNNLDTHCSENAHDKSSMLPFCYHMLHHMRSECRRVRPRWCVPCWCRFDYSTHTCEALCLSFETNDSFSVPQEVWERADMRTAHTHQSVLSSSPVYQGQWPYVWTSALNWYKLWLFLRILQWFCQISNLSWTKFENP